MPDPTKQTISATEAPALFNASPYLTRWMLWQRFANGIERPREVDSRMQWGVDMQPLIIKRVAAERKLEAYPNEETYVRRDQLGCTRDATIIDPSLGPGALEIKCVFDYQTWGQRWNLGKQVPREIEIQLQQQMLVGELGGESYRWGLIAVWVCADLYYFERKPIPLLWDVLRAKAQDFLNHVKYKDEPNAPPPPDPFGAAVELPLLAELFPTVPDKVLDLSDDPDHVKTAEQLSLYKMYKETATGHGAAAEAGRVQFLALAKDAELVKLPCGYSYRVKKSGRGRTIDYYVPDVPLPAPAPREPVGII